MRTIRKLLILILGFIISSQVFFGTAALAIDRSTADRPDDIQGYQVHVVYVVPKGGSDLRLDTDGRIASWIQSSNTFLQRELGRRFIFDTFKGDIDVTFLQSNYNSSELCSDKCNALDKLAKEYKGREQIVEVDKTLLFFIAERLDNEYCGWTNLSGNLALINGLFSSGCNESVDRTIVHELLHTYGVGHTCSDATDIMVGGTCSIIQYTNTQFTIDKSKTSYVGSDKTFGVDILKMPIWSDGSGSASYASVMSTSENRHLQKLSDGTTYAIVGMKTGKFVWDWAREVRKIPSSIYEEFYISNSKMNCTLSYKDSIITGTRVDDSCQFDVPINWRVGERFKVTQTWTKGPWNGSVSASGILIRADLSSSPCTKEVCFVGGTTEMPSYCWKTNANNITLQQLVMGVWQDISTTALVGSASCRPEYPKKAIQNISFSDSGIKIFRWYFKATDIERSYADTPFALVINGADEREATTSEIKAAQEFAVQQGREADLIPPPAETICDITDTGLLCRVSINDRQNWNAVNDETFKWYLGASSEVTLPANTDSFSPVSQFFTSKGLNGTSSITIPYEFIEKLVNGMGSNLRIYAIVENAAGKGVKSPANSVIVKLSDIKASVERAKLVSEAKAKAEAEAKAKAEAANKSKKTTITCTKSKKVKKVTAVNPKCPKGYKKK